MKFEDVLNLNLEQLIEVSFNDYFEDETSQTYALMLRLYKKNELEALNLIRLTDRHLFVMRHIFNGLSRKQTLSLYNSVDIYEPRFQGEIYFYLGKTFKEDHKFDFAMACFQKAYLSYERQTCHKKAVESLYQYTMIQAQESESQNLIPEFEFLIKKALKSSAHLTASKCYYHIGRHYMNQGATELALDYASQALDNLDGNHGVEFFYHALLFRCSLLLDLGQKNVALFDYQKAKASNFTSLKSKLKELKSVFENEEELNLTKTESLLVKALNDGPLNKQDLVLKIYGDKIDWLAAESRFKMLLSRLKRKYPTILTLRDGKYFANKDQDVVSAS